jgi:hypothetical protein
VGKDVEELLTTNETKQLLMRISTVFPNWKPQVDMGYVIATWEEYLKPYSYEQCRTALHSFVTTSTSGFAPTPGQLIEKIDQFSRPQPLNDLEAWSLYRAAIERGGYHAEEEFDKLPPSVQKAAGSAGNIHSLAMDENFRESVEKPLFLRNYHMVLQREEQIARLPENVANLIEATKEKLNHVRLEKKTEIPRIGANELSTENEQKIENLKNELSRG